MRRHLMLSMSCLLNCAAPIDAPSAFAGERYLCEPDRLTELDVLVESCRERWHRDGSCAGHMSLHGLIGSEAVVLDAEVSKAIYADIGGERRVFTMNAQAPYFALRLDLSYFAIPPRRSSSGPVCVSMEPAVEVECGPLTEGATSSGQVLNLEARGGNYLSLLTSVWRDVQIEAPDEMRVAFSAGLARGGSIEGCFHIFPSPGLL